MRRLFRQRISGVFFMGFDPPVPQPPDPPSDPPADPPYDPPEPPEPPEPPQPPLPPGCNPPSSLWTFFDVCPDYLNECLDHGCNRICDIVYGPYIVQISGCGSPFYYAWYCYAGCLCEYFIEDYISHHSCLYVFCGCSDSDSGPPSGLTHDQMTAFTLTSLYNFNPLDGAKYEPDAFPDNPVRSMVLANWHDKTNLLVTYDPVII